MGINGLMSYVGEHSEFFVDLQLRNTNVIIDGNNLYHRLYFDSNLDIRRGGDYDSFTDIIRLFFESLAACNIQPYVVLDGGSDASDKKLTTLKERAFEKIQAANSLSCGGGGSVLPLLVREVFKQILTKLQVPFVQSFSEADRDIVSLANHLNCPVLTLDSDFCIFDLQAGYCPLNYFQWRNLCRCKDSQDCYIPTRCFSLERFCRHFSNMNKTLLPLFAVMSGNDYINLPAIEMFFSKIHLPIGKSRQRSRKHDRIQGLLNWLSRFADLGEAMENVLKYLKKHEKEEIRQLLSSFMEEYEPSNVNLKDFFQSGVYESEELKKLKLPQWIGASLIKGHLPPFVSDALILRRTILHVQVENIRRGSAHTTALPIRQVIYWLLQNTSPSSLSPSLNKQPTSFPPVFHEFDRFQKSLKKSSVQVAELAQKFPDSRYALATLNEVPIADRLLLLWETLGVTASILEPVPCLLQLPMAVTCYWTRCSEPKVTLQHIRALLLGIIFGELDKMLHIPDPQVSHAEVNKIVHDQFLKWKEKKSPKDALELDAAHTFCQWQCCLQAGLYLNQLLCSPLPEPDLTRLYNGTLVHRLYHELKSSSTPENLLSASPKIYQLYCNMVQIVKDSTPPGFFQKKKSKSQRKKDKKVNQLPDTRESTAMDTLPSCSVNNRFAILATDK
ncbi:protein asteroid homolog 1 [Python bivittatus]|uniref:Protein asteroid homolog 1 n=1 Tax=Python bivittatus TaxID=176946 RepID=A0A9F2R8G2_PYTBI|nr:protein asteroid homolog 1 [Python bivittatus]XP_007438594.1 protein asteroid homolog 1 [Python bivittatus]